VVQVLRRDQLEHGVAEVLETLVVGVAALRMLVVVRPVGHGLAEQGSIMKADAKRALKLLYWVVGYGGL
jgi:hypothetical protein